MLLNKVLDSANLVNEQIKSYANSIETIGVLESIGNPEVSEKNKIRCNQQGKSFLKIY